MSCPRMISLMSLLVSMLGSLSAQADQFGCFTTETDPACENPLEESATCLLDQDYSIAISDRGAAATVLAIHGGKIELNTGKIGAELARRLDWNLYEFQAHGTAGCLEGKKNPEVLHLTSTNFNEPQALALVGADRSTIAIHGYADTGSEDPGVEILCVGGRDRELIAAFVARLEKDAGLFAGFSVQAVDGTSAPREHFCRKLNGNHPDNIVNRNQNGQGMQLELGLRLRQALVSKDQAYDPLRELFYGSLQQACAQVQAPPAPTY